MGIHLFRSISFYSDAKLSRRRNLSVNLFRLFIPSFFVKMNIFHFLILLLHTRQCREINAVTKTNRYLEFVEPFLQLFINPKNGKSMKMKITRLRGKFTRYTHRFEKYYYQCGDTSRARRSSSDQKKRVKDYAPSPVSGENQERGFLKEIADTLLLMKAQKTIKEDNIGDLSAYECTVENMEHLWHKINAGFRRNFSRYLTGAGSRCSDKVINRLERRLATDERIVSRFIRVHRD